jgi:hypothetical protein
MRRIFTIGLTCFVVLGWLGVARAQYFPQMHPTERRAVSDEQALLVHWDNAAMAELSAALDCEMWYSFRADGNARRLFAVYEGEDPEKCYNSDVTEYEVACELEGPAAATYLMDGKPLYIGVGRLSNGNIGSERVEWDVLCTFVWETGGAARLLDLIGAQRKFITDLYALDLTNDGLLELACVSSWGVSGGGGIDFVTLEPDGTFRQLWQSDTTSRWLDYPPIIESTIESAYAACSVHDFDGNGTWEVETQQFLDYGGGMGSYVYNVLYTFDPQSGMCYACTDDFPALYMDQRQFYEALAQALADCEANPEPFKRQVGEYEQLIWKYRGRDYMLSQFAIESQDVQELLKSWDEYQEQP